MDKDRKVRRKTRRVTRPERLSMNTNKRKGNVCKVQKITSERITIEPGLFGYGERSEWITRSVLPETSRAVLNEDLCKVIDLTRCTSRDVELSPPRAGTSARSDVPDCEALVDAYLDQGSKRGDYWQDVCRGYASTVPDYEKLLCEKIIKSQASINRKYIEEKLSKVYKNRPRVSITSYKKHLLKEYNNLNKHQKLPIPLVTMSQLGPISMEQDDERQVVPRSPGIPLERCKTPVMETQFSEESYFTPENQRYVYKEPETERYQTCLYMRNDNKPLTSAKNVVDVYVRGEPTSVVSTLYELNCDNNGPAFEFQPKPLKCSPKPCTSRRMRPIPEESIDMSPKSSLARQKINLPMYDGSAKTVYMSKSAKKTEIDQKFNYEFKSMSIDYEPKRQKFMFNFDKENVCTDQSKCYEIPDYKVRTEIGKKHALDDSDGFLTRPRKVIRRSTLKDRNVIEDMFNSPCFEDRESTLSRRKLNYPKCEYDQENIEPAPLNPFPESPKDGHDFRGFVKPRFTPEQYRFRKKRLANIMEKEKAMSPNEMLLRSHYLPETVTSLQTDLSELPNFPELPSTPEIKYYPRKF